MGFLVAAVSFVLGKRSFFRKLQKIDSELIYFLSRDESSREEFSERLTIYSGMNSEKGISVDAILCFLSTKNNSKKVILEVRKSGRWAGKLTLPGGHSLVSDEDLRNTGSREVIEETDLSIEPNKFEFLGVYDKKERDERYVSICYYVDLEKDSALNERACKLEADPIVPKEALYEVEEFVFFPMDKALIAENREKFAFQHYKMLLDFVDTKQIQLS